MRRANKKTTATAKVNKRGSNNHIARLKPIRVRGPKGVSGA